jgi:hypothetical protein
MTPRRIWTGRAIPRWKARQTVAQVLADASRRRAEREALETWLARQTTPRRILKVEVPHVQP